MAEAFTYANLFCDLVAITEEQSLEFFENLEGIVARGEQRFLGDLNIDLIKAEYAVGNTVAGTRGVTIPSDLIRTDALWVTVSNSRRLLLKRDRTYCQMYAPDAVTVGERDVPVLYADDDTESYYLVPSPDAVYAITAYGLIDPDGLSDLVPTTWLSTYYGDMLLKACLIEAENHLTNPVQVAVWKSDYMSRLPAVQRDVAKLRAMMA